MNKGWSVEKQSYWSFWDEITVIDWIAMKNKSIIVHASLQNKALNQMHLNHMGIEKTYLLVCQYINWINMKADIEETIKNCPTCLVFQATLHKDKTMSHKISGKLWESVSADIN